MQPVPESDGHYTENGEEHGFRGNDYTETMLPGAFRGSEEGFHGVVLTSKVVKTAKILWKMHLTPFLFSH